MSDYKTRPCSCGCGERFTPKRHRPNQPAYKDGHKRKARTARDRDKRVEREDFEREDTRYELLALKVAGEWLPEIEEALEAARHAHRGGVVVPAPAEEASSGDAAYLKPPELDPWHLRRKGRAGSGGHGIEGVPSEVLACYHETRLHPGVGGRLYVICDDSLKRRWRQTIPHLRSARRAEGEGLRAFQSRLDAERREEERSLRWPEPVSSIGFAASYLREALHPVVVPLPSRTEPASERELVAA